MIPLLYWELLLYLSNQPIVASGVTAGSFFYLFFLLTMHFIKKSGRFKDKTNTNNNTKNSVVEHKTLKKKV